MSTTSTAIAEICACCHCLRRQRRRLPKHTSQLVKMPELSTLHAHWHGLHSIWRLPNIFQFPIFTFILHICIMASIKMIRDKNNSIIHFIASDSRRSFFSACCCLTECSECVQPQQFVLNTSGLHYLEWHESERGNEPKKIILSIASAVSVGLRIRFD